MSLIWNEYGYDYVYETMKYEICLSYVVHDLKKF